MYLAFELDDDEKHYGGISGCVGAYLRLDDAINRLTPLKPYHTAEVYQIKDDGIFQVWQDGEIENPPLRIVDFLEHA